MKKYRLLIFSAILFVTMVTQMQAQSRKEFWGNSDAFLEEQARQSFLLIDEILKTNPPGIEEPLIRRSALLNLDVLLHDTRNDHSPALYGFIAARIGEVAEALERPPKKGMTIYKLYNHGFIVRTASATVAFDLFRGGKGDRPYIPDALMQRIAERCDILFITHAHGDHADRQTAAMFTRQGKAVIVPSNLWPGADPLILHRRSGETAEETLRLGSGQNLQVTTFPGHQGELINNIYLVTFPEGYSAAHTGDQSSREDLEWISRIREDHKTDVLLVNCWTYPVEELVEGFAPGLVVTGHENEMNHTIDHREPYWLNRSRWEGVEREKLYMTWGEAYRYKK